MDSAFSRSHGWHSQTGQSWLGQLPWSVRMMSSHICIDGLIRKMLRLRYNVSRLSSSDKEEQGKNPSLG